MYYGSIYKIVFPNGKHYIGLTTTSLEQRTKEHKSCAKNGDTKCLYKALRKYDMVDTFELIEIDTADTLEELCEKEIGYIIEYNSYYMNENGYNMTYGGEGANGYVFTEEDKQKMSEAQKKYFDENPEALQKMSERMKKYYENPEERKKQSEKKKKHFEKPEARQQASERMKQHFENPEARQQMSERMKQHFENPEAIQTNREAQKKYHQEHPQAAKEHSERLKTYYENPEAIKKNSEAQKKYYEENPEAKQQMSEIKKKYYQEHPEVIKKILDAMGKNNPFDVFTIDGTFIKTFTYQFEAKEYLQKEYKITSKILLGAVLAGRQKSSAGFVFKYK